MTPALNHLRFATRRRFLQHCASGMGAMALASLFNERLFAADGASVPAAGGPAGPHFAPRAKNMIYLFMSGGPSHLDLFDYKPELNRLDGQKVPETLVKNIRLAQIGKDAALLGTKYQFKQFGPGGMWLSELLPISNDHRRRLLSPGYLLGGLQPRPRHHLHEHRRPTVRTPQHGRPGSVTGSVVRTRSARVCGADDRRRPSR